MFMSNTATTTVMAPLVISFFQSMTGGKDAQKRGNGSMSEMSEVSGKDEVFFLLLLLITSFL